HILRHVVSASHPGIEALANKIAQGTVCNDIDFHLRIATQELENDWRYYFSRRIARRLDPYRATQARPPATCSSVNCAADACDSGSYTGDKEFARFCQRDFAGCAVEEPNPES